MQLIVPRAVAERLGRELRKARRREIGGLLFGEHIGGEEFRVVDISVQRGGGSPVHFIRDPAQHKPQLDEFFERTGRDYTRFNYLGEWHSHPSFAPLPSSEDKATMRDILTNPDVGVNFLVLIIARLHHQSLQLSATGFMPDGGLLVDLVSEDTSVPERWTMARWLRRMFSPESS